MGEVHQSVGAVIAHRQTLAVGLLAFDQVARAIVAVAGIVKLGKAVVRQRLLRWRGQPVTSGIHRVAVGLFPVLATDQAARRVVGVGDDVGGSALLPGTEVHAARASYWYCCDTLALPAPLRVRWSSCPEGE